MPDNPPSNPNQPTTPQYTPGHVPMSEEFDKAKWTLPPALPVAIAAGAILLIVAVVAFTTRPKPILNASITKIARVDQGDDNTVVAVQMQLENLSDKQIWIRDIDSELQTDDGKKFTNHAAPAGDIKGYLKAVPALREADADPLGAQLKLPGKASYTGVMVFSYPVDQEAFDKRKSFTVKIALYDQPTQVVKQP